MMMQRIESVLEQTKRRISKKFEPCSACKKILFYLKKSSKIQERERQECNTCFSHPIIIFNEFECIIYTSFHAIKSSVFLPSFFSFPSKFFSLFLPSFFLSFLASLSNFPHHVYLTLEREKSLSKS